MVLLRATSVMIHHLSIASKVLRRFNTTLTSQTLHKHYVKHLDVKLKLVIV
jgi:hypothetical protein